MHTHWYYHTRNLATVSLPSHVSHPAISEDPDQASHRAVSVRGHHCSRTIKPEFGAFVDVLHCLRGLNLWMGHIL